jgi:hypothetical protein
MLREIFNHVSEDPVSEYDIRASFLEVYNESMYDLLTSTRVELCGWWSRGRSQP